MLCVSVVVVALPLPTRSSIPTSSCARMKYVYAVYVLRRSSSLLLEDLRIRMPRLLLLLLLLLMGWCGVVALGWQYQ